MLTAFKILNKSSLHHEFKQQKHNIIKSHNCLLFVNHALLMHFTVFKRKFKCTVWMGGYLITSAILTNLATKQAHLIH